MISEGLSMTKISRELYIKKSHVSYYIKKAKDRGYVKEVTRDTFKILEITQAGKNFLAMYQDLSAKSTPICRAENIRFKAPVYKMPSSLVDWQKVEMHNWTQYTSNVDCIKVKFNDGKEPNIEFLADPIDGSDPIKLYCTLLLDCEDAAKYLERTLDMRIGRLEVSDKGEWVVYNPLARTIAKYAGRITIPGIGKINASLPDRIGEFEFFDPRAAAQFLDMPRRLERIEQIVKSLECYKSCENN